MMIKITIAGLNPKRIHMVRIKRIAIIRMNHSRPGATLD